MNQIKANEILEIYGKPQFKINNTVVFFSRQSNEDIKSIEALSDLDLVKEYKNLVWINYIYSQVSLSDLQRIDLIELEMKDRPNINQEEIDEWFKKAELEFDESQF